MTGIDPKGHRNNHYVPVWYQERFLLPEMTQRKFKYLDLRPKKHADAKGRIRQESGLKRWGPVSCFSQYDLYTTFFGSWLSTEIERKFFGDIDGRGKRAVEYWGSYDHTRIEHEAFQDFVHYLTVQKLRTPKGLEFLRQATRAKHHNEVLFRLQNLQRLFGAIWAEAEWAIADASSSPTKFIVSDHPVTSYNIGCFPGSALCRGVLDPAPWLAGTHIIFPLSLDKLLILTNTAWLRNPYGDPLKDRPNPRLDRPGMFKFTDVQTGRQLSETEVREVNYVIKCRANRFIAAAEEEWLYPERHLPTTHWSRLGGGLLFMPDPRESPFSTQIVLGYDGGRRSDVFDEYGREPGQRDYDDKQLRDKEWDTFHAFQGEFARLLGPRTRGSSFMANKVRTEYSDDYHKHVLAQENPALSKRRRGR